MAVLRPSRGIINRRPLWYNAGNESGSDGLNPIPPPTTATVAQQAAFDGYDALQDRSTVQTWFDPGIGQERVPTVASVGPSRVDGDWQQDQLDQTWRPTVWYPRTDDDTDGPLPPPAPAIDPAPFAGAMQEPGPDQQRSNAVAYPPQGELLGIREAPPDAPVSLELVDDIDQTGQQERSTGARWFQPDTEAFGDIPRANAPFDPTIYDGALQQQPDPTEQRANGQRWHQAGDPVDGPLRASKYAQLEPGSVDPLGSYGRLVVFDAPIAYWRLDEPFGLGGSLPGWYTPYDVAAYNAVSTADFRTGQWVGKPTLVPGLLTGDPDGAASFDGASYITMPSTLGMGLSAGAFSNEAWVQTSADGVVAAQMDAAGLNGWKFAIVGGVLTLTVNDGTVATTVSGVTVVTDGRRHHVVISRAAGAVVVYVDGRVDLTAAGNTQDVFTTVDYTIGASVDGTSAFVGVMDEVALYTFALNASKVGTHYLTGIQGWAPLIAPADLSEQRAWVQRWFQPDDATEGLVPPVVSSFDPATGFEWGRDYQQDRGIQPTWFTPDAASGPESPIPTPTVATVPAQAGLWQDQSGQQDRGIQPVWNHPPDDTFAQFPSIPVTVPPTTDQLAGIWQEQPYPERGNGQTWYNPAVEPVDGPLQSWLFTTGSPGGGAPPILIDAETGDIYFSIGGNLIVSATNG